MFGKSQFRDEKGEIDLSKIEKRVNESSSLAQKHNLMCIHQVRDLLLSEAVKVVEYYKLGERKEMYNSELIDEFSTRDSLFNNGDKHYYIVRIMPKSSVKHS